MKLPTNYEKLSRTERRVVRLEYIKRQGGRCKHCHNSLQGVPHKSITDLPLDLDLFPEGFLDYPVHLHHDHNTDMTIGAVHAYCNGVLWQYFGE